RATAPPTEGGPDMARQLTARRARTVRAARTVRLPAPRVVHYLDPARPHLAQPVLTDAQLAARQREWELAYTRWAIRQAEIAEHDRKVRRFWLGFGAVVGTAVLAAIGLAGWALYHAVTATG